MSKKIDKFLDEAVTNIREDREITRELLEDAIKWLAKDEARHKEIGFTLSKYVETLQRSNEQLVKIATLLYWHGAGKSRQRSYTTHRAGYILPCVL